MAATRSYSYSADVIQAALRGYRAGLSQREISCVLKVPRTTLRQWIYEYRSRKVKVVSWGTEWYRAGEHPHYWVIPPPSGKRKTTGTCKGCFSTREFYNSGIEGGDWIRPKGISLENYQPLKRIRSPNGKFIAGTPGMISEKEAVYAEDNGR